LWRHFQGASRLGAFSQGVALGYYVLALRAKKPRAALSRQKVVVMLRTEQMPNAFFRRWRSVAAFQRMRPRIPL